MGVHLESVKRILKKYGNYDYSLITSVKTCLTNDPDDIVITSTTEPILSCENKVSQEETYGTIIEADDIKLYVDPSSFTNILTTDSQISDGTSTYTIVKIIPFKEQSTVAVYIIYLRK